jgi:ADP-ribose pyrophosphatase YjhB (NUDIX family)
MKFMAVQPCDHTSVGILVFQEEKLLLIDRKRPPLGLAAPAGHVDKHGDADDPEEKQFEDAARAELEEEAGLRVISLKLIGEGRKENPCRRPEGTWHYWRIYLAEAEGELKPSTEETRGHVWCSKREMEELLSGESIMISSGKLGGLERVWLDWFTELDILRHYS